MALNHILKKLTSGITPYLILGGLIILLFILLSLTLQDASRLSELFLFILGLGIIILLVLIALLTASVRSLFKDIKQKTPGSKFTFRLLFFFATLVLISNVSVYGFSLHFINQGLNSWFDVKVETAMDDAITLSRSAYRVRMRDLSRQNKMVSNALSGLPADQINGQLRRLSELSGALELSVWSTDGQLLFTSINTPDLIPERPNESIFRQMQEAQQAYLGLDPDATGKIRLRTATPIPNTLGASQHFLHVLFAVDENLSMLGQRVEAAYTDYTELVYLRKPLNTIFTLTLTLTVLLTLLGTLWFAVWIARRLVRPLQDLASATESVAAGKYDTQITEHQQDEIGFLARGFNHMTKRLLDSRTAAQHSRSLLEQERLYLGTVLNSLSSGVIALDPQQQIRTANHACSDILHFPLLHQSGLALTKIAETQPHTAPLCDVINTQINTQRNWQQQVEIEYDGQRQTLRCQGVLLTDNACWVVVIDDVTMLLQAQRQAAWGEVARRLAHEIKNPLTPIQLSAERLERKYAPTLSPEQIPTFTKLTHTIVQQVEALKDMVNDFSDYARAPISQQKPVDLNVLIPEILMLYRSNSAHTLSFSSTVPALILSLDSNRIRQLLHNLIKNAIEASEEAALPIVIQLKTTVNLKNNTVILTITDQGPGIAEDIHATMFEPYTTNKVTGTGLGLAVVKKIVEEHNGEICLKTPSEVGTCIIITLPFLDKETVS